METSGAIPAPAVAASELADIAGRRGPFATVYLTTEPEIENAAQRSEQRWKTLRSDLEAQGAPDDLLAAIDPLVADAHLDGGCLAVVASADGVRHVEHLPDPPKRDVGRWGSLPAFGPLIEWHQHAVPHVVMLTDRRGADLIGFRRVGPEVVREVGGDDDEPITKVGPGGWSQRRYQQRAENTWDSNAKNVAAELTKLVTLIDARLVVVAGDVRAVQMVREHLDPGVDELVRLIEGGRSPDGSSDNIAAEAAHLAATVVASDTRALLEKFREERGQADRAADGPAATVTALNEARVAVLLIPGDVDGDETAWFGDDPVPIALSPDTLSEMGVDDPQHGPLLDVFVRAAFGTGAGVRIIPRAAAPRDGIGAILRW